MIFVLSSFIRLSVPISRGTVTGQRNSRFLPYEPNIRTLKDRREST
jgi:hypothetical protein